MPRIATTVAVVMCATSALASWYWPFGSDDESEPTASEDASAPLRLSELMEPAVTNIDNAANFAADGKISEAVNSYRAALAVLDRVEAENPERAATAEFATLRNKRAYVNAAIDSLHLEEAHANARPVSVTDTTELEKKIAERNRTKAGAAASSAGDDGKKSVESTDTDATGRPKLTKQLDKYVEKERKNYREVRKKAVKVKAEKKVQREISRLLKEDPTSRKARLMQAGEELKNGNVASAKKIAAVLLAEKPGDGPALNMRAACEVAEGNLSAAERTLDQAMMSNPRDHHAYYNMANVYLLKGNPDAAKRFYETGRTYGGKPDAAIEKALKK